jgi:hypothetical protein
MQPDNTPPPQSAPPSGSVREPLTSIAPDAQTLETPLPDPQSRFGPIPIYFGPAHAQAAQQSMVIWSRFRAMPRKAQVLMAVGVTLTLVVASCCSCTGLFGALGPMSAIAQSTATRGSTNAGSVSYRAGAIATATEAQPSPTAQPTATATAMPQPTATPKPRPQPTATPTPKPTCIPGAVNCNPWGYTFTPGHYIFTVPAGFCTYFACSNNFYSGKGFVMECHDGMYSKSGGFSGSCSHHGGNWRPLYAP